MSSFEQAFGDFGKSFNIKKFPSSKLFKYVLIIFLTLVIIGGMFFEFKSSEIGIYFTSSEYALFIKIIPKSILLIFIIYYNIHNKIKFKTQEYNKLVYFLIFSLLILGFFIIAFLTKEFVGQLAQFSMSFYIGNKTTPSLSIDLPEFIILSAPAIFITAYFQLVISNQITLLILNLFRSEK